MVLVLVLVLVVLLLQFLLLLTTQIVSKSEYTRTKGGYLIDALQLICQFLFGLGHLLFGLSRQFRSLLDCLLLRSLGNWGKVICDNAQVLLGAEPPSHFLVLLHQVVPLLLGITNRHWDKRHS